MMMMKAMGHAAYLSQQCGVGSLHLSVVFHHTGVAFRLAPRRRRVGVATSRTAAVRVACSAASPRGLHFQT